MNLRLRKKRFKKINGENPPKWLKLLNCRILPKPQKAGGTLEFEFQISRSEVRKLNDIFTAIEKKNAYKRSTDNLVNTTRILSERRSARK